MKGSEKKLIFNFFVPLAEVSQNFWEGNEAQDGVLCPSAVTVAALSEMVEHEGRQYGLCLEAALTWNPGLRVPI